MQKIMVNDWNTLSNDVFESSGIIYAMGSVIREIADFGITDNNLCAIDHLQEIAQSTINAIRINLDCTSVSCADCKHKNDCFDCKCCVGYECK